MRSHSAHIHALQKSPAPLPASKPHPFPVPVPVLSSHLPSQGRERPVLLPVLLIPLPQDNFKGLLH